MLNADIARIIRQQYPVDLQRRVEEAEAEKQKLCEEADHLKDLLKEAEEENRKLRGIMVQLRKTERPEKCSVVFEMTYSDALSAEQIGTVAGYVFRAMMKADQERRTGHE